MSGKVSAEKPNGVVAHEIVMIVPTDDPFYHVAHKFDAESKYQTGCGERALNGLFWSAMHAIMVKSHWCRRCW